MLKMRMSETVVLRDLEAVVASQIQHDGGYKIC